MAGSNVVLLVDYENIFWSMVNEYGAQPSPRRLIESLSQVAEQFGSVNLKIAYADFDHQRLAGVQSELQRNGVDTRHVFSKTYSDTTRKNAADIEMSLDALEMVFTREDIDVFVLAAGDRDYIQIIKKLHQRGKKVPVIAVDKTASKDLKNFADEFFSIEDLLGFSPAVEATATNAQTGQDSAGVDLAPLIEHLDWLEKKMPFVGAGYFVKKLSEQGHYMGQGAKGQDVFNQATAEGVVETYEVPNPASDKRDSVTRACRLNRANELVQHTLSARTTTAQGIDGGTAGC